MRMVVPCLAAVAFALAVPSVHAQASDTAKYDLDVRDVYGNPMRLPETDVVDTNGGSRTYQTTRSINGNMVKLDGVTEKVLKKDDHTLVIERTVQHFDPNGNITQRDREVITEVKGDDGSLHTTSETWRSDVNGQMTLAEKKDTLERKTSPDTVEAQTTVSKPTINGSFDVVERDEKVKNASAQGKWSQTETIWRPGQNGFYQANRVVTEHSETKARISENTAEYEIGSTGNLELHQQTTKNTVRSEDGSSVTQTDYFNRHAPGYAYSTSDQLALRAREISERKPAGGSRTVDTLSVQQPSISDPTRLEPPKLVSETVCSGACK